MQGWEIEPSIFNVLKKIPMGDLGDQAGIDRQMLQLIERKKAVDVVGIALFAAVGNDRQPEIT